MENKSLFSSTDRGNSNPYYGTYGYDYYARIVLFLRGLGVSNELQKSEINKYYGPRELQSRRINISS